MRLIFYSHHAQKLIGTVGDKIEAFLTGEPDEEIIQKLIEKGKLPGISERMGCVAYSKETKCFYLLPLKGYNTRIYTISRDKEHKFKCNCQGWAHSREIWKTFTQEMESVKPLLHPHQFEHHKAQMSALGRIHPPSCSHVGTVFEYFARRHRMVQEERIMQATITMFEASP